MSDHLAWYVARSSGIIAWALVTLSLLWGLSISTKVRPGGARPAWLLDLHRYLAAVGTTFTFIHVGAIVADSYTDFGVTQILVPLASTWRPGPVAWGIVALYLLVAVQITSYFRAKMPRRLWKAIHLTSLPLYAMATIHLVQAGSEASHPLLMAFVWASVAAVAIGLGYRLTARNRRPVRSPSAALLSPVPATHVDVDSREEQLAFDLARPRRPWRQR